jgi:hypothetical protein
MLCVVGIFDILSSCGANADQGEAGDIFGTVSAMSVIDLDQATAMARLHRQV